MDEAASETDALVGTTIDGRYQIERLLGSGAMGSVYRGLHMQLRKLVAIKVLHKAMTLVPEVVARFEREAVAAARVEHPNIAKAMDFGRLDDGSYYLALEYVEGQSLRELIAAEGPLAPDRAVRIATQVVGALVAAHAAGIVHRDLKPDNVMLVGREGDVDSAKVLDFGIAKVTAEDMKDQPALTRAGTVFGTPEYMAPEQAMGHAVDARADLYSVGIILYEMLVGTTPFAGDDLVVVLTRQMTEAPAPLPATVDAQLSALVMALLAKSADERVQTARDLQAHLEALTRRALGPASQSQGGVASPVGATLLGDPPSGPYGAGAPGSFTPSPPSDATPHSWGGPFTPGGVGSESGASGPSVAPSTPDPPRADLEPEHGAVLMVPQANTLLAAPPRGAGPASPAPNPLMAQIKIGGRLVPAWALGSAAVGAIVFVFVISAVAALVFSGRGTAAGETGGGGIPALESKEAVEARLVTATLAGDADALEELEKLDPKARSATVWHAIGRAHGQRGRHDRALAAYEEALGADAKLAEDAALVADVRRAAEHATHGDAALRLATRLGPRGADLIFDVWASTKSKEHKKLAWELLAKGKAGKEASPALAVAIDLVKAKTCGEYKAVLPRAAAHADARSEKRLAALTHRRGCGFLGLGDCFECLRRTSELSDALKSAKARPAPVVGAAPAPSPASAP